MKILLYCGAKKKKKICSILKSALQNKINNKNMLKVGIHNTVTDEALENLVK